MILGDIIDHAAGPIFGPAGPIVDVVGVHTVTKGAGKVDDLLKKDKHSTLTALAAGAGVSDTRTAAAVAIAESGGRANATNRNSNGTQDTGLWQINDIHAGVAGSPSDLPSFRKWLMNPVNNAKAMASISNGGTDWSPWTTYNTGKYKLYLGKDRSVLVDKGSLVGDAVSGAVDAVTSPLESIGRFFAMLTSADTWFRIAKTWTGGLLIVLGTGTLLIIAINNASRTPAGRALRTVKP